MQRWRFGLVLLVSVAVCTSCLSLRYIGQAAVGQLELMGRSRPIDEVIRDPDTDQRTRILLQEVLRIRTYAAENGLKLGGSYRDYIELNRRASVWMVSACEPLAFEPRTWSFPIAGTFPVLGWFSRDDAIEFRNELKAEGLDVYMRGAGAYSTGGWFKDPIVSSMLSPRDDAFRYLTNIVLHELVHATVFVPDQTYFDESLATFVGDKMAEQYLVARFGPDSGEVSAYREELAEQDERSRRLNAVYKKLDSLYAGSEPDAVKLREKARILTQARDELELRRKPNNAYLIGFKVYNTGFDDFDQLYQACGSDWTRFIKAVGSLDGDDFAEELQENFGPVVRKLTATGCRP